MKTSMNRISGLALGLFAIASANAEIVSSTANNGNLVMEDVPAIPEEIVAGLNRYQNVRSAAFRDWTQDSSGVYISKLACAATGRSTEFKRR